MSEGQQTKANSRRKIATPAFVGEEMASEITDGCSSSLNSQLKRSSDFEFDELATIKIESPSKRSKKDPDDQVINFRIQKHGDTTVGIVIDGDAYKFHSFLQHKEAYPKDADSIVQQKETIIKYKNSMNI